MLDSSTSSSKKSTLLCSVPGTPTSTSIGGPLVFGKQPPAGTPAFMHKGITGATSSIASSIQDSLNQLSLSTTSSQTHAANQQIECADLGLPTEPIKINLSTSKQTSDYNSDTSSSNEWNSNTWSLSLESSNNRNKLNGDGDGNKFVCPKPAKFKTPFAPPSVLVTGKHDKYTSTTPTNTGASSASSTLLRNTYNSQLRQHALNSSLNKPGALPNQQTSSTLQEDLLRLINPDSYLTDNGDNLSEVNSNSSNPLSNESSNTQYSTPYSSLERSNTSCSNKEYNQSTNNNGDRKAAAEASMITAQPAQVVSNRSPARNNQQQPQSQTGKPKLLEKSNRSSSMEFLCKLDNQLAKESGDRKSQSASKAKKYSFDSNSTTADGQSDWSSLVNNASKALALAQQANSLPATPGFPSKKSLFKGELQSSGASPEHKASEDCKGNEAATTTCQSPATIAAATLNQQRQSLDKWIKEFEDFSKNANNLLGGDAANRFSISNSAAVPDLADDDCFETRNPIEPSQLDAEKVKSLEDRLKKLQLDLVKEQSSKLTLEEQVKHLEEENRRLHNESVTGNSSKSAAFSIAHRPNPVFNFSFFLLIP